MLISHEIPKDLFPVHDLINDYPYVLAHLIGVDEEYTDFYKRKCAAAPYSILDNSAFELGKSVDFDTLLDAADLINPSHVIIPDWVNNSEKTIEYLHAFLDHLQKRYKNPASLPFKLIAVIQGTNLAEIYSSLNAITYQRQRFCKAIDTVAVPFDTLPNTDYHNIRYIVFQCIKQVLEDNFLQVHLLGLQNFSEYYLYSNSDKRLIRSVDTSAPIIYGWNGIKFEFGGTAVPKPSEKLADNLDIMLDGNQVEIITHNVQFIKRLLK